MVTIEKKEFEELFWDCYYVISKRAEDSEGYWCCSYKGPDELPS